jgi:hypothetical protein
VYILTRSQAYKVAATCLINNDLHSNKTPIIRSTRAKSRAQRSKMQISPPSCRRSGGDAKNTVCNLGWKHFSGHLSLSRILSAAPKEAAKTRPDDLALEYTPSPLPLDWHNGCSAGTRLGNPPGQAANGTVCVGKNLTRDICRGARIVKKIDVHAIKFITGSVRAA